jgi:hypothetical protein
MQNKNNKLKKLRQGYSHIIFGFSFDMDQKQMNHFEIRRELIIGIGKRVSNLRRGFQQSLTVCLSHLFATQQGVANIILMT